MNVQYSVIRKPINKTEQHVPWEHEQFACIYFIFNQLDKAIHGATLSGRGSASIHPLDKGCIYDNE